ncbi:MAG TPA: hypothetical protein VIT88_14615 [Pyrinomonadaceae bacterium]
MKTLFVLASVLVVLFLAAPNKVEAQEGKTAPNNLEFLRKLKDGPINNYLDKPIIKKRLQNLIGRKRFKLLYGLSLNRPNEISDDVFVANGCMPHFCPNSNFILIIEIAKNTFHVGIRDNNRIKIYSEKNITPSSQIQRRIQEWKDESEL